VPQLNERIAHRFIADGDQVRQIDGVDVDDLIGDGESEDYYRGMCIGLGMAKSGWKRALSPTSYKHFLMVLLARSSRMFLSSRKTNLTESRV
jgi:hypothetical protein